MTSGRSGSSTASLAPSTSDSRDTTGGTSTTLEPVNSNANNPSSYLACAKDGTLSATSEAVSPLETFSVFPTADTPGTFQIQTLRDTFLGVSPGKADKEEVRGSADAISFATTLRIRMQARFKPRVKTAKEDKARDKVSRRDLEEAAGRKLDDDEVRRLKRARREGDYHEQLLMIKVKGKHDKYS
jgi:protein FRG1